MQLAPHLISELIEFASQYYTLDETFSKWLCSVWVKQIAKSPEFNAAYPKINGSLFPYRYAIMRIEWSTSCETTFYINDLHNQARFIEYDLHGQAVYIPRENSPRPVCLNIAKSHMPFVLKDGILFCGQEPALDEMHDLWDWWRSNPGSIPSDLTRLSRAQALQKSKQWHDKLAKRREESMKEPVKREKLGKIVVPTLLIGDHPTDATVENDLAFEVYELLNYSALAAEGDRMANCVASYDKYVTEGYSRIFALVGPSRTKSYTLETDLDMRLIKQLRGYSNQHVPSFERNAIACELLKLGFKF